MTSKEESWKSPVRQIQEKVFAGTGKPIRGVAKPIPGAAARIPFFRIVKL